MKNTNSKLDFEDILALDKVSDLIKEFSDKNPIKKYTIDSILLELKRQKDQIFRHWISYG